MTACGLWDSFDDEDLIDIDAAIRPSPWEGLNSRLFWLHRHVMRCTKPIDAIGVASRMLRDAGRAAPIDSDVVDDLLVGAASRPSVTVAEVRLLAGRDPARLNR